MANQKWPYMSDITFNLNFLFYDIIHMAIDVTYSTTDIIYMATDITYSATDVTYLAKPEWPSK